jgi:hypothetical protein
MKQIPMCQGYKCKTNNEQIVDIFKEQGKIKVREGQGKIRFSEGPRPLMMWRRQPGWQWENIRTCTSGHKAMPRRLHWPHCHVFRTTRR